MALLNNYKRWRQKKIRSFRGGMVRYNELLATYNAKNRRVLHFGCGRDLSGVSRFFKDAEILVGVDVDRSALEHYPAPSWHLKSHNLPFPDNTFDLILSEFVLEHLERPDEALGEIFRVLAPSGKFLSVAPNRWSYKSIGAWIIPNHLHAKFVRMFRPDTRRELEDIYPTYFRANSARDLHTFTNKSNVHLVRLDYINNGPTWFQRIPGLFELGILAHNAMELRALARLRCNLIAEFRKIENGEKSMEPFACFNCGSVLRGDFPKTALTCIGCDRVYAVHNGVYA